MYFLPPVSWAPKTSKMWSALHYLPNTVRSLKELTFSEVESSKLFHQVKWKHSEGRNPITIISPVLRTNLYSIERWTGQRFFCLLTALGLYRAVQAFSSCSTGLSWPWGMWDLSFSTRDCTLVCCIAKWILNHLTMEGVPVLAYWQSYFPVLEIRWLLGIC